MSDQPQSDDAPAGRVPHELGRALLRFQQLERQIKKAVLPRWVIADHSSPSSGFETRRQEVTKAPLGWLKEELIEKLLHPEGSDPEDSELQKAERRGRFAMQFRFQIPQAEHAQLSDDLTYLHQQRNWLVHHFLDDFELSDSAGCMQARKCLDQLHAALDERIPRVESLLRWLADAHAMLADQLIEVVRSNESAPDGNQTPDEQR